MERFNRITPDLTINKGCVACEYFAATKSAKCYDSASSDYFELLVPSTLQTLTEIEEFLLSAIHEHLLQQLPF